MIQSEVQIVKITTMADGTVRAYIDFLQGGFASEELKQLYEMREKDTTVIIVETKDLNTLAEENEEQSYKPHPDEEFLDHGEYYDGQA